MQESSWFLLDFRDNDILKLGNTISRKKLSGRYFDFFIFVLFKWNLLNYFLSLIWDLLLLIFFQFSIIWCLAVLVRRTWFIFLDHLIYTLISHHKNHWTMIPWNFDLIRRLFWWILFLYFFYKRLNLRLLTLFFWPYFLRNEVLLMIRELFKVLFFL